MVNIKTENVTTSTRTGNQNPPAIVDNQNATAIRDNGNGTAMIEHHQSSYAAASSSSRVILANPRIIEYLQSFPPGFRFKPTDEELILAYLKPRINNYGLHPSLIHDADIYKKSPYFLSANYVAATETEWYFLSPREKKYANGKRPNRAAGNGFWKATGADKSITSRYKGRVGFVKTLVYFEGTPKNPIKTTWIMKEYRVNNPLPHNSSKKSMKLDDYVLYKIYEHKKDKSDATNVEGGEADGHQDPPENIHDDAAELLNNNQDHGLDGSFVTDGEHINQQYHVDNSSGQQQQQQLWPIWNPNYSAYHSPMFPNMSMPMHQMHGDVFYPQNHNVVQHETLYSQQTVSDQDAVNGYIPHEFPHAMLPGADGFNYVQALNNESNISQGFSPAIPPPADAPSDVQAFDNEVDIPQMQQPWNQGRLVMTRPSSSSGYHPYHHPEHFQQ